MVSLDLSNPHDYGIRVDDHRGAGNFYRAVKARKIGTVTIDSEKWVWLNDSYVDGELLEWRLRETKDRRKEQGAGHDGNKRVQQAASRPYATVRR